MKRLSNRCRRHLAASRRSSPSSSLLRRYGPGGWNAREDDLADVVTRLIDDHAPGFESQVVGRRVLTPAGLEARFQLSEGCLYQVEMALDQLLYMRPLPGWSQYRMPVRGLYLCGSGCHPGGGITGLPGKNAAETVLADSRKRRAR